MSRLASQAAACSTQHSSMDALCRAGRARGADRSAQNFKAVKSAPAEHAGDVLGQLALAQLDVVGAQVQGVAAQLEEALESFGQVGRECRQRV